MVISPPELILQFVIPSLRSELVLKELKERRLRSKATKNLDRLCEKSNFQKFVLIKSISYDLQMPQKQGFHTACRFYIREKQILRGVYPERLKEKQILPLHFVQGQNDSEGSLLSEKTRFFPFALFRVRMTVAVFLVIFNNLKKFTPLVLKDDNRYC